jgi:hypothetical protein
MNIISGGHILTIHNQGDALKLEIIFNQDSKGKIWKEIGDALYNFEDITLSSEKFSYIRDLASKNLVSSAFSVKF